MCRLFASEGARVYAADRTDTLADPSLAFSSDRIKRKALDVTRKFDWDSLVSEIRQDDGRLDVLVNNAGVTGGWGGGDEEISEESWNLIMDVNAKGVFFGMQACSKLMGEGGGGAIVNMSSISGIVGFPAGQYPYVASKGAVRSMTKSAALKLASLNIRVNSVHPGVLPPMRSSVRTPEQKAAFLSIIPLKREGVPAEVAKPVLFLCSEDASYITGAELLIDGGLLAM